MFYKLNHVIMIIFLYTLKKICIEDKKEAGGEQVALTELTLLQ